MKELDNEERDLMAEIKQQKELKSQLESRVEQLDEEIAQLLNSDGDDEDDLEQIEDDIEKAKQEEETNKSKRSKLQTERNELQMGYNKEIHQLKKELKKLQKAKETKAQFDNIKAAPFPIQTQDSLVHNVPPPVKVNNAPATSKTDKKPDSRMQKPAQEAVPAPNAQAGLSYFKCVFDQFGRIFKCCRESKGPSERMKCLPHMRLKGQKVFTIVGDGIEYNEPPIYKYI